MCQRKPKGRGESNTTSKKGLRRKEKKESKDIVRFGDYSGSTPSSSLASENCATIFRNKEVRRRVHLIKGEGCLFRRTFLVATPAGVSKILARAGMQGLGRKRGFEGH